MVHRGEVLEAELGAEHVPHLRLVGIVALGIDHAADVDAREGHEDDAAILINMVLRAEQLDLGRGPSQIVLPKVSGVAD